MDVPGRGTEAAQGVRDWGMWGATDGENSEQTCEGGEGASPVRDQRGRAFGVGGTAVAEGLRPECRRCARGTMGGIDRGREEDETCPGKSWGGLEVVCLLCE